MMMLCKADPQLSVTKSGHDSRTMGFLTCHSSTSSSIWALLRTVSRFSLSKSSNAFSRLIWSLRIRTDSSVRFRCCSSIRYLFINYNPSESASVITLGTYVILEKSLIVKIDGSSSGWKWYARKPSLQPLM